MSENLKMEDLIEKTDSTSETAQEVETTAESTTEQDPLKEELIKVQKKESKSEIEKATFSLRKNAERLKELGGDPNAVLGVKEVVSDDDDAPVTMGMLKKMQQENAAKTALQMTEEITNETERELVRFHLENSIKLTGNPAEDLNLARAIVNATKNKQILDEVARKGASKSHSSASSAAMKQESNGNVELTEQEILFTKAPFNLKKDEIIAARPKS